MQCQCVEYAKRIQGVATLELRTNLLVHLRHKSTFKNPRQPWPPRTSVEADIHDAQDDASEAEITPLCMRLLAGRGVKRLRDEDDPYDVVPHQEAPNTFLRPHTWVISRPGVASEYLRNALIEIGAHDENLIRRNPTAAACRRALQLWATAVDNFATDHPKGAFKHFGPAFGELGTYLMDELRILQQDPLVQRSAAVRNLQASSHGELQDNVSIAFRKAQAGAYEEPKLCLICKSYGHTVEEPCASPNAKAFIAKYGFPQVATSSRPRQPSGPVERPRIPRPKYRSFRRSGGSYGNQRK